MRFFLKILGPVTVLLMGDIAFAQTSNYVPLVNIPGISNFQDPTQLINGFIRIIIVAAALLAVGRIIWGGIKYLTTEAVSSKGEAKDIIRDALSGLLLVLASVLILQIINPDILKIRFFSGTNVQIPSTTSSSNSQTQSQARSPNQTGIPQSVETPPNSSASGVIIREYPTSSSCPSYIQEGGATYVFKALEGQNTSSKRCSYQQV